MKKGLVVFLITNALLGESFILAEDVSDILNRVKISEPNTKNESYAAEVITTGDSTTNEINAEAESTSSGITQFDKTTQSINSNPLRPGEVIVSSYKAYLSDQDHFSSTGSRLGNAAAIIRQDRANFHKFGQRDAQDEGDDFFSSPSNRAALEQMLNNGSMDPIVDNEIINGNPLVLVRVIRTSIGAYYIQVYSAE
jgi:hypothetical protein